MFKFLAPTPMPVSRCLETQPYEDPKFTEIIILDSIFLKELRKDVKISDILNEFYSIEDTELKEIKAKGKGNKIDITLKFKVDVELDNAAFRERISWAVEEIIFSYYYD